MSTSLTSTRDRGFAGCILSLNIKTASSTTQNTFKEAALENGLPHPTIDGVWAKKAKQSRQSYLFIDFSAATVDQVIDQALAGVFGYIQQFPVRNLLVRGSIPRRRTSRAVVLDLDDRQGAR